MVEVRVETRITMELKRREDVDRIYDSGRCKCEHMISLMIIVKWFYKESIWMNLTEFESIIEIIFYANNIYAY